MLVVASGFAFNDWYDVEADRFGHPNRALPAGRLSRRSALGAAFALGVFSILVAGSLGPWAVVLAAVNLAISSAYSLFLKGTLLLGNLSIAYLNATILIFGARATDQISASVWLISGFAFVFTCAQEVLYNISDHAADTRIGVRTTAVRLGKTRSIQVFNALILFLALASVAIARTSPRPVPCLLAVALCLILPFHFILALLRAPANDQRISRACLMMGAVRILSLIPVLIWQAGM
jgi:geranylgeranylglycerol-phosphate geranylgeranyltransferase